MAVVHQFTSTQTVQQTVGTNTQMCTHSSSFDPLCGQGAGSYGRTTTKRLESGINDFTVVIHFDLAREHKITFT